MRVKIAVCPEEARAYAWEVAARLALRKKPSIVLRDDLVEHGELYLDPCNVTDDEADIVVDAIAEEMQRFRDKGDGLRRSWSDVKRAREAGILGWSGGGDAA